MRPDPNLGILELWAFCATISPEIYVVLVLLDAPKTQENPSGSKVGPKVGFGGGPGLKQPTFDLPRGPIEVIHNLGITSKLSPQEGIL